jgi:hypothetical protein
MVAASVVAEFIVVFAAACLYSKTHRKFISGYPVIFLGEWVPGER